MTQMTPVRSTTRTFGKCATYDLSSHKHNLVSIEVLSPMDIAVHFHDKKKINLHRELSYLYKIKGIEKLDLLELLVFLFVFISKTYLIAGDHYIHLTTSKNSALSTASRPCYEGNDYGDQEYFKLVQLVKERVHRIIVK